MHETIPQPAPPIEDYRVAAARQALAELPPAEDNERPRFWVGRLRVHVASLVDGWPAGAPGGLSADQREVLAAALSDAAEAREASASDNWCADCDADPSNLCCEHAADLDLSVAYTLLARELGLEADR